MYAIKELKILKELVNLRIGDDKRRSIPRAGGRVLQRAGVGVGVVGSGWRDGGGGGEAAAGGGVGHSSRGLKSGMVLFQ